MWAQGLVFSQTRLSLLVAQCIFRFICVVLWNVKFFSSFISRFYSVILIFDVFPQNLSAPFFFPQLLSFLCVYWDFAVCWLRSSCETSSWLFCFLQGSGHFPAAMNCVNTIAGSSRSRGRKQENSMSLWFSPGQCSQCVRTGVFCLSLFLRSWSEQPHALLSTACRQWKNPISHLLGL